MLKKALQVVATIGLLSAGYVGYVRGFAIVSARVVASEGVGDVPGGVQVAPLESPTQVEAARLAVEAFGKGHWSADPARDKILCINDTARGFWFYAGGYTREGDGRRVTFTPFALVTMSKDRKSYKTISGRQAILDFNEPFGFGKPGGKPSHVVHARITDEVAIRDNRGTPKVQDDDLVIDELTYLEYDEHDLQIRSTSPLRLRDRNLLMTGEGLLMELRAPEGDGRAGAVGGFNGVRDIWVMREIRIHMDDAGKSGILPINARANVAQADTKTLGKDDAKAPLDLDCRGPMHIKLPAPVTPVLVGPPAPVGPTLAKFEHDVRVRRGAESPKQLNCDTFLLTLVPAPKGGKPAAPAAATTEGADPSAAPADAGGPLSELVLRRADADGHAVWLQSESEGLKVRCNQLVHEKPGPGLPDVTYLRGDKGPKLHLEKEDVASEGPEKGKVRSFSVMEAIDATIYQDGSGGSRIIARGPGWLESRPGRNQPVEREATWQDELVMETKPQDVDDHRIVTLTGMPTLKSPTQGSLSAVDKIILCLVPDAKPSADPEKAEALAVAGAKDQPGGGFRIQWLQAFRDVRMVSASPPPAEAKADAPAPAKRTMWAKDWLYVKFEAPAPDSGDAPAPVAAAEPSATPPIAAPAQVAAAEPPKAADEKAEPKPPEPDMDIKARQVWARVEQRPGQTKSEVREVRLRHDVTLHQGPAPGKTQGTDASGEAIDLLSEAPGRARVLAHGPEGRWARIITEGTTIEGPVLGLDQAKDYAWVDGQGRLSQLADRNALGGEPAEKDPDAEEDKDQDGKAKPAEKRPVVVTWRKAMEFHGRTIDLDTGKPGPAMAFFYGDAVATMDDSRISCQKELAAVMDKAVSFVRPKRDPEDPKPEAPEPKPQIVALHGVHGVDVSTRKVDPETGGFLELQRIQGEDVYYDRPSGKFRVLGEGRVRLYDLADKPTGPVADGPPPLTDLAPEGGPAPDGHLIRVAARPSPAGPANRPKPRPPVRVKPKPPEPEPLMLTQILFHERMEGQFFGGPGTPASLSGRRESRFYGGVEVLRARVGDDEATLDSDRPPLDLLTLSARTLKVESQPAPPKSKAKPRSLLRADGDSIAESKGSLIQGDYITFDSKTELAYASGMDGHPVVLVQQSAVGQARSEASGRAAVFNIKTGQGELLNPGQITFLEGKGVRFGPIDPPGPPPKPIKPKRLKPTLPSRSDINRRGFSGR